LSRSFRGERTSEKPKYAFHRYEDVVVDTVEELLQVDGYHEGVSLPDMLLRLGDGLMRRAGGAKTVARRREPVIPFFLT